MAAPAHLAIIVLDQLIMRTEELAIELQSFEGLPVSAFLAAEQVAADLHDRRRLMLEEVILSPVGEG